MHTNAYRKDVRSVSGYTVTYQMRKKKRQRRDKIVAYLLAFVAVIFAAFLIVRFLCASYTVQGDSMLPTYQSGEKRLVNRLIYKVKSPSRYDIILFESEDENNRQYYVKRVIGLPGETVTIKNGDVYVDGRKARSFGTEKILSPGLAADGVKLSKNQYFVIGDNYNNSEDSRSAVVGNVKKTQIIGKVGMKYWPFG
jgi:signal peptidase I